MISYETYLDEGFLKATFTVDDRYYDVNITSIEEDGVAAYLQTVVDDIVSMENQSELAIQKAGGGG
jgi:hypothetical protein|tara:strand:- start:386 stop:583 length:198 start_codon:yes stop_codon:yes gene_type:complete